MLTFVWLSKAVRTAFVLHEKCCSDKFEVNFFKTQKAMAKDKIAYVCSNCGQESAKWIGKCPACGQWNTYKEIRIAADSGSMAAKSAAHAVRNKLEHHNKPQFLHEISSQDEPRIDMQDAELNRVLGGGLGPGRIGLLGGEPGIGKSTLTLQTILRMQNRDILYVSGEESAHQIKMRAERIGGNAAVQVLCETSLENIFDSIKEAKPELVIIDSIQTISTFRLAPRAARLHR